RAGGSGPNRAPAHGCRAESRRPAAGRGRRRPRPRRPPRPRRESPPGRPGVGVLALAPHFEAPNQIKASAIDRGPMVRIPLGNERSARVEVRSIAPDANPYLAIYTLLKVGLEGPQNEEDGDKRPRTRFLPDNIYDAIRLFKGSRFMQEVMGEDAHAKFAELKLAQAERCPKALGTLIKASEVQLHHEVTNQFLWSQF